MGQSSGASVKKQKAQHPGVEMDLKFNNLESSCVQASIADAHVL
jgi:hypothetical protein